MDKILYILESTNLLFDTQYYTGYGDENPPRATGSLLLLRIIFPIPDGILRAQYDMMPAMTAESPATTLCKSCGLCCTGHLFIWAKLRSAEMDSAQALGLQVIREPHQRGFSQPCPLWDGVCTVYTSPYYPRFCHTYKCKLLKEVLDENIPLEESLTVVQQAMGMIQELETFLPASSEISFRERLVAHIEQEQPDSDFRLKASGLSNFFEKHFGVSDFFDKLEEQ